MAKVVLLVGGSGYLGRGIRRALESRGHKVVVVDQPVSLFEVTEHNAEECDFVVNLAVVAEPVPSRGIAYESDSWRTTVEGTVHLLRLCEAVDVPLIQFSTREAHGQTLSAEDVESVNGLLRPVRLVAEDVIFSPTSPYGRSKLISEWLCEASPMGFVVRLGTPYSDETPRAGGGLVATLVRNAVQQQRVVLDGGGRQFRDPLHTDDLAELLLLIEELRPAESVFNAGFGGQNIISLREIALAANPDVEIVDREGGDFGFAMDTARALDLLKWRPKVLVRERIPHYVRAYSQATGG